MKCSVLSFAAASALLASAATAQVILNEVFENPPGSAADQTWEYIELYGRPGMDLTGYAVALIKGGLDSNGDNIPDGPFDDRNPEIDEAFGLDGWSIGPNGFFVIYNANSFGESDIFPFLTPNPAYIGGPESPTNKRFLDGASFATLHIPSTDTAGKLNNDGSSTYVLVRKRPNHSIVNGQSVYGPGYAFRKDVNPDVNFDGKLDFGAETPIPAISVSPSQIEPLQIVDAFAWSNGGGKEYVISSQQEISDTPGFNPDAVSRLRYLCENPNLGHRTRDLTGGGFEILPTRTADECFIYGEVPNLATLLYDTSPDGLGWPQTKAPTDTNAMPFDGSCDPEPDNSNLPKPTNCLPSPGGVYYFTDLNVTGFKITPASFNDHPTNPALQQFRFVTGDFNFDGVVDAADLALITSFLGASLDDTTPDVYDNGTPNDTMDDLLYDRWSWQMCDFQRVLMMLEMDMTDGPGGANADVVTQADIDAVAALIPPATCNGDADGNGSVDIDDITFVVLRLGATPGPCGDGDLDGNGIVNTDDLTYVVLRLGTCGPGGC